MWGRDNPGPDCHVLTTRIIGKDRLVLAAPRHEDDADHHRHQCDNQRIPQTGMDIATGHRDGRCEEGQKAAEPAVADVIWQRQAGIADACGL